MKIGIITLHRVRNYGSALQTYALQEYIEKERLGDVELIDYIYPNSYHRSKRTFKGWLRNFYCVRVRNEYFRKGWKKRLRFEAFYKQFFHLSAKQYKEINEIMSNPPKYDLYMTGSDQLWNVNTLKNDPVMYCEFAPSGTRRVSFGASFTTKNLPEKYHESVRNRLNKYTHIGVREFTSLQIIDALHISEKIEVENTCDPTLLLNAEDYQKLAGKSSLSIGGDYILVYTLKYAFSPEPALSSVIKQVREHLGYKVVVIDSHKVKMQKEDRIVSGIGPNEFCWLFAHAKFIIASSFHGTMFALINRKPFAAIGPQVGHEDRRIKDILDYLALENNYYPSNQFRDVKCENPYTDEVECKIERFIEKSKRFLNCAIKGKSYE